MFKYVTCDVDDTGEGDTLRAVTVDDIAEDIMTSHYDGEPPLYSRLWTMTEGKLVPVETVKVSEREAEPGERWGKDTWRCEFWQTRIVGKEFADGVREDFKVWINTKHEKA